MNCELKDIDGKVLRSVELDGAIFDVEMNEPLLHSVLVAYNANQRQGTHATKTRSLVSGGGKKPFRQKGTGNARQGSSRSPLMPGGGTAHGPQPRDYRQKLTHKMKQLALKVALSDKARAAKVVVLDDFKVTERRTKQVTNILANLGLTGSKVLFVDKVDNDYLYKSSRNIHRITTQDVSELNTVDVLHANTLVCSEAALQGLTKRLRGEDK